MSRRQPKPARTPAATDDADTRRQTVERLLVKGNAKEAFKQAKFFFHKDASPENRHLVESTYLHRIRTLIQDRMTSAGREVALSMLEFGVKDPALMQEAILLLPQVGLADKAVAMQGRIQSPEAKAQLSGTLADRAVLHPEEILTSLPELHAAAAPVRSALAALDTNDSQALELLQPIPRSSPLSDWRFFVRGLLAFRQSDLEQAKANWQRLEPKRAAQKIAQALLVASDEKLAGDRHDHLKALESCAFGEPVLDRLTELRQYMESSDWKRALQLIGPLRRALHRIDPRYAQKLTGIVLMPLSTEIMNQSFREAERMMRDFKAVLEPLPWDPKWNRFDALLWEGPQGSDQQAIQSWQKYLQDLEQGVPNPLGEPRQVRALVLRRIGVLSANLSNDDEDDEFDEFDDEYDEKLMGSDEGDELPSEYLAQAVEALQQSMQLDPTQQKTYRVLIELAESNDRPELLLATLEKLHVVFPEDVDALRELIEHHQSREEPELVLKYNERLRSLRPLDAKTNEVELGARLTLARHMALQKRWDEGRAEFARVEASLKEQGSRTALLTRRAAFEFKAGDATRAEEYITEAKSTVKEPTALWLSLAIEAIRYKLPESLQQRFDWELVTALGKKVSSETAADVATLMMAYFAGKVEYEGRAGHVQEIVKYLKRTTRLKYREQDLRSVLFFLRAAKADEKLSTTLVNRGVKLFPSSPFFLVMDATDDMSKGPFAFDAQRTRKKLEKALALAEASQNPEDTSLISDIKKTLAKVQDLGKAMSSFPFMPDQMPTSRGDFRDILDAMMGGFGDREPDFEDDEPETDKPKRSPKKKPR